MSQSKTVSLSGTLVCETQAQVALVKQYLPEHVRLTRNEPGCLSFDVTQTDDPMVWRVEEQFVDAAAFHAHQARTKATIWAAETQDIKREYTVQGLD